MWIFSPIGFYSAVQKPGDTDLTVRSRERQDLVNLLKWLPDLDEDDVIQSKATDDYGWRMKVSKDEWASVLAAFALLTDYSNFKNEVKKHDPRRAEVYGRIWGELADEYGAYGQPSVSQQRREWLADEQ